MTLEAKIRIIVDEKLAIDRSVRVVAHGATFPQCFVLENKRPRLLAMALSAGLITASHCQPAGRFEYIGRVRIVTLNTIHPALNQRVVLRQVKFGSGLQVALETGGRIVSRVEDELASAAARLNVFATWAVTGFATDTTRRVHIGKVNSGVRAGRKRPGDVGMAVEASLVSDKCCARNLRWQFNRAIQGGAGVAETGQPHHQADQNGACIAGAFHDAIPQAARSGFPSWRSMGVNLRKAPPIFKSEVTSGL